MQKKEETPLQMTLPHPSRLSSRKVAMNVQELIDYCKGNLIGRLVDEMKEHCSVYYPEFALGTALCIIAAAAQRAYLAPGGHFICYNILVGPPGCGKNDYLAFAQVYIKAIESKLLSPEPRSSEAIKLLLSQYPSRVVVTDEIGNMIAEGARPESRDVIAKSVCNMLLELWNPKQILSGSFAKDPTKCVPDITAPRFSLLGAMTSSDLHQMTEIPQFASKGLYSRLALWVVRNAVFPDFRPKSTKIKPASDVVEALVKIERQGRLGLVVEEGDDARTWLEEPAKEMGWNEAGLSSFKINWSRLNEKQERYHEHADVASGVISRAKSKSFTFSALHALARAEKTIGGSDVMWGTALGEHLLDEDLERFNLLTQEDLAMQKVVEVLKARGCGLAIGDIRNGAKMLRRLPRQATEQAVKALASDGRVKLEQTVSKGALVARLI